MPNFICEELVMKNGKVDIVEQEFSKLWNDKIQRLEKENKELKEEKQKLKDSEKYLYQKLLEEQESHSKTLNNMLETLIFKKEPNEMLKITRNVLLILKVKKVNTEL